MFQLKNQSKNYLKQIRNYIQDLSNSIMGETSEKVKEHLKTVIMNLLSFRSQTKTLGSNLKKQIMKALDTLSFLRKENSHEYIPFEYSSLLFSTEKRKSSSSI
jgi:hypothetical protein